MLGILYPFASLRRQKVAIARLQKRKLETARLNFSDKLAVADREKNRATVKKGSKVYTRTHTEIQALMNGFPPPFTTRCRDR